MAGTKSSAAQFGHWPDGAVSPALLGPQITSNNVPRGSRL
jgi:hypothetical protein